MLYGVGLSYNGTQGVMKQSGRDVLSFNIDLRYRKGKFSFDNKFTFGLHGKSECTAKFFGVCTDESLLPERLRRFRTEVSGRVFG